MASKPLSSADAPPAPRTLRDLAGERPAPNADESLLLRARAGDADAFSELVLRYQDRVFNTLHRICHSDADAADLAQAAFLKAWQSLARFEAKSSFFTWLYRIAVNLALSDRRGRARRRLRLVSELDNGNGSPSALEPPADDDAARALDLGDLKQRIADALDELDDEFKTVVILKDIDGLDYAQIVEILDLPLGTVKSRLHRGRLRLREILGDASP